MAMGVIRSGFSHLAGKPLPHLATNARAYPGTFRQSRRAQSVSRLVSKHFEPKSLERYSEAWKKLRLALERHGDPIITCANLFQLGGFACSDALHLQSIMIFGNGGMALFFITRIPTMKVPFGWAFLKVCVNVYMVFKLTSERQPVNLTPEELDIYEEHFMPYGITARQFRKFWDLGVTVDVPPNTLLVVEGKPQASVSLVLSGHVFRTSGGKHVPGLDSFPGARDKADGDAGAWIAEVSALRMIDTVSASESISRELYRRKVHKALADVGDIGDVAETKSHALKQLEEGLGVEEEQVDALLQHSLARWTVHTLDNVTVRSWELKPIVKMCKSDHEMSSMLRKAFSQSVIMKMLAMDSVKTSTAVVKLSSSTPGNVSPAVDLKSAHV
eukprot:TRINITY_DN27050_c0_g1_i1.p1 TRINITY_DN27050_c0_g1~~TRINITY_DN27050_c0_g1_i1.p1  ORF type:complete len:387 (-),score=63.65 TRINITY_DN27050_c0_g1_i1:39-1199(-)